MSRLYFLPINRLFPVTPQNGRQQLVGGTLPRCLSAELLKMLCTILMKVWELVELASKNKLDFEKNK